MTATGRPLVVCLVGTDHHPFDRVIGWCDQLAANQPDIEVLVQHGRSPAPHHASGQAFFDKAELLDVLERAHVAISHGGPGTISEIRSAGLLPIVVPRDPERGEHVDGHQQRFVARMDKSGLVEEVRTEEALVAAVTARLSASRGGIDSVADRSRIEASVARFAELVDGIVKPGR